MREPDAKVIEEAKKYDMEIDNYPVKLLQNCFYDVLDTQFSLLKNTYLKLIIKDFFGVQSLPESYPSKIEVGSKLFRHIQTQNLLQLQDEVNEILSPQLIPTCKNQEHSSSIEFYYELQDILHFILQGLQGIIWYSRYLKLSDFNNIEDFSVEGVFRNSFKPFKFGEIKTYNKDEFRKDITCLLLTQFESLRHLRWKHWKTYDNKQPYSLGDLEQIYHYYHDQFAIFIEIITKIGIPFEHIAYYYRNKQKINIKRQEEGY